MKIIIKKRELQKIPNMTTKLKTDKSHERGKIPLKLAAGAVAGFINGLFGGGGGMIVVPCLIYLLKYETGKAHATAIAIILPLSVLSGLFYTAFGDFTWEAVGFTTLGVTTGGVIGAFLLKNLAQKPITLIFSVVMALAGVKMLFF